MKQIFREIKNSNYKKCKSILLENHYEIHARDDFDNTPLHLAVKNSNYDICKLLLEFGADVNACDQWGNRPLHIATQWIGRASICKLLLDYGAFINAQNNSDNTSLHYASYKGFDDLVELLLNYNAKISIRNVFNKTPYDLSRSDEIKNIIKFRIRKYLLFI
jgi:ankyrin repeat protein